MYPRPSRLGLLAALTIALSQGLSYGADSRVDVEIVTDQADAALLILERRRSGAAITPTDWDRLWESSGYKRLVARQLSFGDEGTRQRLADYLSSEEALERLPLLRSAVAEWKSIDISAAAELAAAYTPPELRLEAKVFPVIKQRANSFVADLDSDAAIFMFVDGEMAPEKLINTLAHELHHVGVSGCPRPTDYDSSSTEVRRVIDWLSAFGEGLAVLAAAGSPDVHPHGASTARDWIIWERDVANFNRDLKSIEAFFSGILDGTIPEEDQRARLFTFINTDEVPQGAFYTVGWKMAALIERARGRKALLDATCDKRQLLSLYDAVAAEHSRTDGGELAQWSAEFLAALDALGATP